MDWKTELGIQLREGRTDSYLRQEDVRKRADIHVNMIGRYERGDAAPDLELLIRLAKVLDKMEFHIGDHLIIIKAAGEADTVSSDAKQMRLEFGKEYLFDGGTSTMKIQPSKGGIFIAPVRRKAAA